VVALGSRQTEESLLEDRVLAVPEGQREPAFLRRKQVEVRTGLSRSTIYQYIKDGTFPKPVSLGPRAVAWLESEVSDWITARVKRARGGDHRA
jgi:prophage regulatory protein